MKANKLTKETILDLNATDRGFPKFGVGDTIEVALIVQEGSKERLQMFLGDVIGIKTNGISSTFTIRKMGANNIGVEKILPYYSPIISKITVVKHGDVRRAKLYYIRDRVGRATRIKEKIKKANG
ncbi:50S ribosomal protein L19 [Candidatus Dependentiae bacterium]|nr:50S ribosomal protein L19 [Candidatus Dependentiae bacterium]